MTITRDKLIPIIQFVWPSDRRKWSVDGDLPKLEQFAAALLSEAQEGEPVAHLVERHSFRASQDGQDAEGNSWLEVADKDTKNSFPVYTAPPSSDQVWNEALEEAAKACSDQVVGDEDKQDLDQYDRACVGCADAIRSLKRPSQAQEPTNGELLRAIQGTIPLVEPVHITKALRAGRKAQVCLSGGTGPLACVMLVNIQLTPWIHSEDTAKAFADGYNRALEQHCAVLLELIKNFEAQPSASGAVGEQSAQVTDEPVALALSALKANHEWHQNYDDHGGYPESELCEQNTKAIAALSRVQAAPEGWKRVPIEPTEQMRAAALVADKPFSNQCWGTCLNIYRAMLAAAPSVNEQGGGK